MTEVVRLELVDTLTIYNTHTAKNRLLEAVRTAKHVELDLSHVGELDTAGFQLLVLAKRESLKQGKTLRIVAHSQAVRDVIDFYNMDAYFGDPMVIPAGH